MVFLQRILASCAVLAVLWPFSVVQAAPAPSQLCEAAAQKAAETSGVPLDVLRALMLVESGRVWQGDQQPWPWTINDGQKGHWFDTEGEALAYAQDLIASGVKSFDLGCFQINYRWHGQKFSSLTQMLDPETNAAYAARFLSQLKASGKSWSLAAGAYHSLTPEYAEKYREKFDVVLAVVQALPDAVVTDGPIGALPVAITLKLARSAGSLVPLNTGATRPFIEVR